LMDRGTLIIPLPIIQDRRGGGGTDRRNAAQRKTLEKKGVLAGCQTARAAELGEEIIDVQKERKKLANVVGKTTIRKNDKLLRKFGWITST